MVIVKRHICWIVVMLMSIAAPGLLFQGCKQPQSEPTAKSSNRQSAPLGNKADQEQQSESTAKDLDRSQQDQLTDLRVLENAFKVRQNNLQVTQQGQIVRILADDTDGDRHQRCIVELASGQSVLIAHNIDIAPRVPNLAIGTTVIFHGEYEWNEQGGVVHWTHHDPDGRHEAGWLRYQGKMYQ